MTTQATGGFDLDGWEEQPWAEAEGLVLARVRATKTFHGDAEGTSVAELVTVAAAGEGVAYGGLERFTGSLHGRSGMFVLHHDASRSDEESWFRWSIVPGSGRGELAGITGEGRIIRNADGSHAYAIDYHLG